jgi:eukaryotic-like serine/threonine-protein kinase
MQIAPLIPRAHAPSRRAMAYDHDEETLGPEDEVSATDDRTPVDERWLARQRVRAELFGGAAATARLGRFVVLETIGAGGMGEVYAAYDPSLDRKVAIKVIRDAGGPSTIRHDQLRAEAQAMARLSHPNVVTVHEVGAHRDRVYIAMEFVAGHSLRRWLRTAQRSWREIVDVFVQAGEGLAAAHAAGLIHRDFKPDNVLVGNDGRVRVADFGLAREEPAESSTSTPSVEEPAMRGGTRTTGLVGTPRYFAPEQYVDGVANTKTDQFAFCVALHEALYGEHPFAGETTTALALSVCDGERRPLPADGSVPVWIRRALDRGLSLDPDERFESMRELVAALSRRSSVRRGRLALGAAAAGGAALAATLAGMSSSDSPCTGAEAAVAEAWSESRARRLQDEWEGSGEPYASDVWSDVSLALDMYASRWVAAHRDACEATRVRGEQSEALLDRRMICLQRRRTELTALVEALTTEDPEVIRLASRAVADLRALEPCSDLEALQADVSQPDDPTIRVAVDETRDVVSHVQALESTGRYAEAMSLLEKAEARAEPIAFAPLNAELAVQRGRLHMRFGDLAEAKASLEEAIWTATAIGDVASVAEGTVVRLRASIGDGDLEGSRLWLRHAEAAVTRSGRRPDDAFLLEVHAGHLEIKAGRHGEAEARYQQALQVAREHWGEESLHFAEASSHLGMVAFQQGRYTEAVERTGHALELLAGILGARHPQVADQRQNLAVYLKTAGHPERALEQLSVVLDVWTQAYGPDRLDLALVHGETASVLRKLGRIDDALPHAERAAQIRERVHGPHHPETAHGLLNLAEQYLAMNDPAAAGRRYQQAWDILAELNPPQPLHIYALINMGELARRQAQPENAVTHLERALEIADDLGIDTLSANALHELGIIALDRNQIDVAVDHLTRCVSLLDPGEASRDILADARFRLGQALFARGDRDAAIEQAKAARADFDALGDTTSIDAVDAWLRPYQ